jgi:chemotaxis protein methyltransferase CheR
MEPSFITDQEFGQFRQFLLEAAGISLSPAKKPLVSSRLAKRLQYHGLESYGDYYELLAAGTVPHELQTAIDLLTTNETYFFRKPKHFNFLREKIASLKSGAGAVRGWSAASSSGEEAYTIAMVLAETLGTQPWEIVGTDISSRVVARAQSGHYPMERAKNIDPQMLRRYCMKGTGAQAGTFLISRDLRKRVSFRQANLNAALPDLGMFDFVFLRNVMIYFDLPTKQQVVRRVLPHLKPGGYLMVSHSESLNGVSDAVKSVAASIYRKP